jgi:hypothetical protein
MDLLNKYGIAALTRTTEVSCYWGRRFEHDGEKHATNDAAVAMGFEKQKSK